MNNNEYQEWRKRMINFYLAVYQTIIDSDEDLKFTFMHSQHAINHSKKVVHHALEVIRPLEKKIDKVFEIDGNPELSDKYLDATKTIKSLYFGLLDIDEIHLPSLQNDLIMIFNKYGANLKFEPKRQDT